ncbi:hypothetical protein [Neolewinella antarctica]|uniref:Uncharacterized protein n=1 Tax=Neolewinella antarctica TaxID=442734 RepID=A0ABX0X6H1_9BACT|nr:hypothetical protein [Neolewinella antarctica]NJC24591.1 hypothetical protein [Neolewinella antarctica]
MTYDQIPGIVDTTVIELDVEPFAHTWKTGDPYDRTITGKVYNRDPWAVNIFSQQIGIIPYPNRANVAVDSIVITRVLDAASTAYGALFVSDGWVCVKTFIGRFVDKNTIKGQLYLDACRPTEEGESMPDNIRQLIDQELLITFRRLQ